MLSMASQAWLTRAIPAAPDPALLSVIMPLEMRYLASNAFGPFIPPTCPSPVKLISAR